MQIYNGDCAVELCKIKKKINLVVVDLPYGQTDCKWDVEINFKKMWTNLEKICAGNCIYVFFCTTRFGYKLIQSRASWFRYDLVWEKSRTVGHLSANKSPMRKHEMIYIFSSNNTADLDNSRNLELRAYAKKIKQHISTPVKEIHRTVGNQGICHFYSFASTQFNLPTEKTYNILIEKYDIQNMKGFIPYESLKKEWEESPKTYNPQKTKGKPYKAKGKSIIMGVYGKFTKTAINNKGTRYPTTILRFDNPKTSVHVTQKPVALCEWLIKTYSNKNDVVLDFTMGSGTTGIACLNTERQFIGIEKDKDIFKLAKHRIFKHALTRATQPKT